MRADRGQEVNAVKAKLALAGFHQRMRYLDISLRASSCRNPTSGLCLRCLMSELPQQRRCWLDRSARGLAAPGKFDMQITAQAGLLCKLPDMMDLMLACVEAGLSLDAAVQRVGEELELRHPIIAGHMRTLSLELRAGKARKNAWRAFADRMAIEEAGSLATMLRQAEEMGTSLGQTLRVFSADMRQRRILYAEEKAMALPAKLTLPLIFFVFPVLLGVLTLPAVVMLGKALG